MLVLVCAHNTLFSLMFSAHLRVHWKTGCLSSVCYNKNMITGRLKQLMFIFSVLEVGSPRLRCLWMWPGEGPFPDLQMAVFLLQMSSHSGGQREGKVLFSCKCEGHHEGSTFMTAWLPPRGPVSKTRDIGGEGFGIWVWGAHNCSVHSKELETELHLQRVYWEIPCEGGREEEWEAGLSRRNDGAVTEALASVTHRAQGALELGWPFRVFWDEARNWPPHWPVTGYRLLLGKGLALGRAAPFGQGQWLGSVSAVSPCAAGDLVAYDSVHYTGPWETQHTSPPSWPLSTTLGPPWWFPTAEWLSWWF